MSLEDYIAVQGLYARQCWANDQGDADAYAATFTVDAALTGPPPIAGRQAIRQWLSDRVVTRRDESIENAQHWVSNLVVDFKEDQASARCYVLRIGRSKVTKVIEIPVQVHYEDELERSADTWLIRRRTVHRH